MWGFSYNKDELIKKYIEELNQYHCDNIDFQELEDTIKRIPKNSRFSKLIKDLNKKIDIDFIKESEQIESTDKKLTDFLKDPDTFVIEKLPKDAIWFETFSHEVKKEKLKEIVDNTKLFALNKRTNQEVEVKYTMHLYALISLFEKARRSRDSFKKKGSFIDLNHYDILETNEALGDTVVGFGQYRSPYKAGSIKVEGANWVPEKSEYVSDRMDALLEWYNHKSNNLHPIVKAAILHSEFIRIHPFVDGNGRTARLLTNYELIRNGFPSVIIKAKNKENYIKALDKAITTKDVTDVVKIIKRESEKTAKKYISIIEEIKEHDREK